MGLTHFTPPQKSLKTHNRFKLKCKSSKLLENLIGGNIGHTQVGDEFSNITINARFIKEKSIILFY